MAGEISIERLEQTLDVLRRHGVEFFHGDGWHIRFRREPGKPPEVKPLPVAAPLPQPAAPEEEPAPALAGEDPDLFFSSGG